MVKNEIRPLTGIRGLAALSVVIYHYKTDLLALLPSLSLFNPLIDQGGIGVDIFFVLSGFVISYVYKIDKIILDLRGYAGFLVNRIARIYPNYLFCFILLLFMVYSDRIIGDYVGAIKHVTSAIDYPFSGIFWHLSMLQAWPFVPAKWSNWNSPAWSVSAEWFAYLFIFPLSVWMAANSSIRNYSALAIIVFLTFFIAFRYTPFVSANKLYFVLQVSSEYLTGCCVYLYYLRNNKAIAKYSKSLDFVFIMFLIAIWFSASLPLSSYYILFSIPLLIIFLIHQNSIFSRILASNIMCYLGRISYSLYLVHAIVQRILHVVVPTQKFTSSPTLERFFLTIGYVVFPIMIAAGIYHLVEEPSRIAIRRIFQPKAEASVS
jgi:peptidoglycan/LPS O-acetylase OafA/YrhL